MQWLLALALTAASPAPAARIATLEPLRVTVTLGAPRVISVESAGGWSAPASDVVAPVPLAPARLQLTLPADPRPARRVQVLGTI